jgi:hypothetical protein
MHERWGNEMEEDLWRLSHSLIHTHTHVPVLTRISALFIYINLYTSITIFFQRLFFFIISGLCVWVFLLLLSFSTLHIRVAVVVLLVLVVERPLMGLS